MTRVQKHYIGVIVSWVAVLLALYFFQRYFIIRMCRHKLRETLIHFEENIDTYAEVA